MFSTSLEQQGQFPLTTSKVNTRHWGQTSLSLLCSCLQGACISPIMCTPCASDRSEATAPSATQRRPQGRGGWGARVQLPPPWQQGPAWGTAARQTGWPSPGAGTPRGPPPTMTGFAGTDSTLTPAAPAPPPFTHWSLPTGQPIGILLLVLPLNNTCRLIVNFDGTELDSPPTPSAENSKGFSIYYSQISC